MSATNNHAELRKLMDWVRPDSEHGNVVGMLTTSYELDPTFFESDFLPTFLGLGAWDDTSWASRVELQRALAQTDAAALMMDARRYRGRPRSLHIEVTPAVGPGGTKLHAKVLIVVQQRAIRLLVGSANLTVSGYRSNREVALPIVATAKTPLFTGLVREALNTMPDALKAWWTPAAERVRKLALETMDGWQESKSVDRQDHFVWSWSARPLLPYFTSLWPGERISRVSIISPFWSDVGEGGPVATLLEQLGRDYINGAELRLFTEAAPETQNTFRPQVPAQLASWDARQLGVNGYIQAVDPHVLPEEVGGRTDYQPLRALHAKIVIIEGLTSTLAYIGSANFTKHGWGLAGQQSNVEAGLVLLRKNKSRLELKSLIPRITGKTVPLNGKGRNSVSPIDERSDDISWPTFIREIRLVPIDDEQLELRIALTIPDAQALFSVSPINMTETELLNAKKHVTGTLEPEVLQTLLRDQRVIVHWNGKSTEFPINVDLEARVRLPVRPGEAAPSENILLAYYQGRIAPEDVYPPPLGDPDAVSQSDGMNSAVESAVDTSRIQSYQVREFVEALQGLRDDLKAAALGTESAMKQALLGEISPVALARASRNAAKDKQRSATATGFQLVEILSCLADAVGFKVGPNRALAWKECLRRARTEIISLLQSLIDLNGTDLGPKSAFHRYRTAVLKKGSDG